MSAWARSAARRRPHKSADEAISDKVLVLSHGGLVSLGLGRRSASEPTTFLVLEPDEAQTLARSLQEAAAAASDGS